MKINELASEQLRKLQKYNHVRQNWHGREVYTLSLSQHIHTHTTHTHTQIYEESRPERRNVMLIYIIK